MPDTAPALYVPTVSGLWSHSHNPEFDLMKRFVVFESNPARYIGWLAVRSFHTAETAADFILGADRPGIAFRVDDNHGKWGSGEKLLADFPGGTFAALVTFLESAA